MPTYELARIITPDCEEEFGYDFRGQVWYASDGTSWAKAWIVIKAALTNFWVQLRFIVRALLVGWLGFIGRASGAFIGVAVSMLLLIIVKKPVWFFAWTTIAVSLWYFPSAPGDFYVEFIMPIFEGLSKADITITTVWWIDNTINQFIDWLYIDTFFELAIDYFRFPNFSTVNPLGTPDLAAGEVTCFIISTFSGFPGIIFLLVTFVALLMTFATGLFWLLLTWLVQLLWLFAQWIYAWFWLFWALLAKEGMFKNMRKYITNKSTNPRLRSIAHRLRTRIEEAGTAKSLAATSRA
jgi:hypothetical protein